MQFYCMCMNNRIMQTNKGQFILTALHVITYALLILFGLQSSDADDSKFSDPFSDTLHIQAEPVQCMNIILITAVIMTYMHTHTHTPSYISYTNTHTHTHVHTD